MALQTDIENSSKSLKIELSLFPAAPRRFPGRPASVALSCAIEPVQRVFAPTDRAPGMLTTASPGSDTATGHAVSG